jgi:hypothetical protein
VTATVLTFSAVPVGATCGWQAAKRSVNTIKKKALRRGKAVA